MILCWQMPAFSLLDIVYFLVVVLCINIGSQLLFAWFPQDLTVHTCSEYCLLKLYIAIL